MKKEKKGTESKTGREEVEFSLCQLPHIKSPWLHVRTALFCVITAFKWASSPSAVKTDRSDNLQSFRVWTDFYCKTWLSVTFVWHLRRPSRVIRYDRTREEDEGEKSMKLKVTLFLPKKRREICFLVPSGLLLCHLAHHLFARNAISFFFSFSPEWTSAFSPAEWTRLSSIICPCNSKPPELLSQTFSLGNCPCHSASASLSNVY